MQTQKDKQKLGRNVSPKIGRCCLENTTIDSCGVSLYPGLSGRSRILAWWLVRVGELSGVYRVVARGLGFKQVGGRS